MIDSYGGMVLFDPNSERERERQMERERAERERNNRDSRALVPAGTGRDRYGGSYNKRPVSSSRNGGGNTGMELGYYGRGGGPPPPVPAKVFIHGSRGAPRSEELALSQELSLISIGGASGSGGGRPRRNTRY